MTRARRMSHVPVSEAAVLKRLNRRLQDEGARGQIVRKNRAAGMGPTWFHIDRDEGRVIEAFDDLEAFAREQGVLEAWEHIES